MHFFTYGFTHSLFTYSLMGTTHFSDTPRIQQPIDSIAHLSKINQLFWKTNANNQLQPTIHFFPSVSHLLTVIYYALYSHKAILYDTKHIVLPCHSLLSFSIYSSQLQSCGHLPQSEALNVQPSVCVPCQCTITCAFMEGSHVCSALWVQPFLQCIVGTGRGNEQKCR